jgi:hypothetical protein
MFFFIRISLQMMILNMQTQFEDGKYGLTVTTPSGTHLGRMVFFFLGVPRRHDLGYTMIGVMQFGLHFYLSMLYITEMKLPNGRRYTPTGHKGGISCKIIWMRWQTKPLRQTPNMALRIRRWGPKPESAAECPHFLGSGVGRV